MNILPLNNEGITIIKKGSGGGGGGSAILSENITYSALVAKRDAGQLVAGQRYRITDYITTTATDDSQSAGNLFDLIVTALDSKTLDENARAIQSERDTDGYFANSDLNAWDVKYCLDNDMTKGAFADTTNGTGVIYRLTDEWGNSCPYDFKNIQFLRQVSSGYVLGSGGTDTYLYTFSMLSATGYVDLSNSTYAAGYCHSNVFADRCWDNVYLGYPSGNYFMCIYNIFDYRCIGNSLNLYVAHNKIKDNCTNILIQVGVSNTVGSFCSLLKIFNSSLCEIAGQTNGSASSYLDINGHTNSYIAYNSSTSEVVATSLLDLHNSIGDISTALDTINGEEV